MTLKTIIQFWIFLWIVFFLSISSSMSQATISIEQYDRMRDEMRDQIRELKASKVLLKDSLNQRIESLERELTYQNLNTESLKLDHSEELSRLQNKLEESNAEIKRLKAQVIDMNELQMTLDKKNSEIKEIKEEIRQLTMVNQLLETDNLELKSNLHNLMQQMQQYEVMEKARIKELSERTNAVIDQKIIDPLDPELLELKDEIESLLNYFPESEDLNISHNQLTAYRQQLIVYDKAKELLNKDYDGTAVGKALADLRILHEQSPAFQDEVVRIKTLLNGYCELREEIRSGINSINRYPPRMVKKAELEKLRQRVKEYPYLQNALDLKEDRIMEDWNPLNEIGSCK